MHRVLICCIDEDNKFCDIPDLKDVAGTKRFQSRDLYRHGGRLEIKEFNTLFPCPIENTLKLLG